MLRSLHVISLIVLIYSTLLFARTEGMIQLRIFGFETNIFPRWAVWSIHIWGSIFFYGGSFLLIKGYKSGWMKSIEILGKKVQITNENRETVVWGIWMTGIGLVVSLAAVLVPTKTLEMNHIELGSFFVIGVVTSLLPSIWVRRVAHSCKTTNSSNDNWD
jgi:hypothetical protein